MLKELSWYIEKNRFNKMVEEIEVAAQKYSNALLSGNGGEKEREEFRRLCQWHMEKSGYGTENAAYINVDAEFFNGANINREALDTFEKEIIKAHIYQKHLWEFMGTTGLMTVISQSGMKRDGFSYEKYLPLEYKKTHKAKSPISNILEEFPNAVPVYVYPDGSVSGEYDPKRAKIRFDVLKDRSGFDWSRKGWDPNYEVEKKNWYGEYDGSGSWVMVKEDAAAEKQKMLPGARFQPVPVIEIIRERDNGILYDPGFSLLETFERVYILTNGEIYGSEQSDIEETVKLITTAMEEMGVKQIKAIAGVYGEKQISGKNSVQNEKKLSTTECEPEQILKLYKKIFGGLISEEARIKTAEEAQKVKKEALENIRKEQQVKAGRELMGRLEYAYRSGNAKGYLINAVRTNRIKKPLSVFNKQDCLKAGMTKETYDLLQNYAVPDEKRELFSRVILNLLAEVKQLAGSGKTIEELFDAAYENVVNGTECKDILSIETTFEEICRNPQKIITEETVEDKTIQALKKAWAELPEQENEETRVAAEQAVENVIRNFSAIRMSTGMRPEEAVRLAVKTVGGKTGEAFVPAERGIVYARSGMDGKSAGKRIFSDIALIHILNRARNAPAQMKEAELKSERRENIIKTVGVNLADSESRASFFKTQEFIRSGIRRELIDAYIASVEHTPEIKKGLIIDPKLFAAYAEERQSFTAKEDIAKLFAVCGARSAKQEVEAAKPVNLFDSAERKSWYGTEGFRKMGVTEEEIEQLVKEENAKRSAGIVREIPYYSKSSELDRQYGTAMYGKNGGPPLPFAAARIETVTKSGRIGAVIEALKEQERSAAAHRAVTARGCSPHYEYIPAQITADGRLGRQILGAVKIGAFGAGQGGVFYRLYENYKGAAERTVLQPGGRQESEILPEFGSAGFPASAVKYGGVINNDGGSTVVSDSDFDNARLYTDAAGDEKTPPASGFAVDLEYISEEELLQPGRGNPYSGILEGGRMARINANYEYDKKALAKEDPAFAKNRFSNTGHAEEDRGGLERNVYKKALGQGAEEGLNRVKERYERGAQ